MTKLFTLLLYVGVAVSMLICNSNQSNSEEINFKDKNIIVKKDEISGFDALYYKNNEKVLKLEELIKETMEHIKKQEGCAWEYDSKQKKYRAIKCEEVKYNEALYVYKKRGDYYTICFGNTIWFNEPEYKKGRLYKVKGNRLKGNEIESLATCEAHFKQRAFYNYYLMLVKKLIYKKKYQTFNLLKKNEFIALFSYVYHKGKMDNKMIDAINNYLIHRTNAGADRLVLTWLKSYKKHKYYNFNNRIKTDLDMFFNK